MARIRRKISYAILDKLDGDEEFFPLCGNDHATPISIRMWAHVWMEEIRMGARPESDRAQVRDGLAMATRMEIRLRDIDNKRKHDAVEWDGDGRPKTGAHAHVEHSTTSGANES